MRKTYRGSGNRTMVSDTTATYELTVDYHERESTTAHYPRDTFVRARKALRDLAGESNVISGWRWRRITTTRPVTACVYCDARPSVWEPDCDGYFDTYTCDHSQCRKRG